MSQNDYPRFHFCADGKEWTVWIEEECSSFSQICFIDDEFAREPCRVIECDFPQHLLTMIKVNNQNTAVALDQFKEFVIRVLQKVIWKYTGGCARYEIKYYVDEVVPRIYKKMVNDTIDKYVETLEFPEVKWACKADNED